jgi:acyl carrier protein
MNNKIADRIKNVMSSVFEIPIEEINNKSTTDTIESWDSLKHMNLVIALEKEFNVQFTDDNIIQLVNMKLIMEVLSETLPSERL